MGKGELGASGPERGSPLLRALRRGLPPHTSRDFLPAPLPRGCPAARTAASSLLGSLDARRAGAVRHRGGSRTPVSGPAWAVSSMEKLVSVEEAERKKRSSS
ncbi:hypothetical protein J1605_016980 [Eschrichtius robustus]|uniref:Uncharacterized protein n=1 Tax=Eschrichtius robustus TaxID=9764 RepID=A0AB34I0C0_ESCRO|nr:hypothetical protein J1605_016980 [Eschrichtius robustus]